ncbi:hypothetical protein CTI12_AA216810 [Artemisia annua]|uniref:Uncharacterized protein n=1 Tax=Artemisia annua TaxID=35608 RepID=A0A2U1NX89_ARTAN|nr:hypothetical protein CTI12_AA216810 [Artemisia annua]
MPLVISPQWQEKATGCFSSSGTQLKKARQSTGSLLGLRLLKMQKAMFLMWQKGLCLWSKSDDRVFSSHPQCKKSNYPSTSRTCCYNC